VASNAERRRLAGYFKTNRARLDELIRERASRA
jgi:hypothetical protein